MCDASPGAAGGDHRHLHRLGERAGQWQVVAGAGAVGVDRRHEQLAGPALHGLRRPIDSVATRGFFPACVTTSPAFASIAQTTACDAELLGEPGEDGRVVERGAVDRDLVGTGAEERRASSRP